LLFKRGSGSRRGYGCIPSHISQCYGGELAKIIRVLLLDRGLQGLADVKTVVRKPDSLFVSVYSILIQTIDEVRRESVNKSDRKH
jgi:hypothetical protein